MALPTYESTISYSYDAGDRLIRAADSVSGTITRSYDGLNRLTSEVTPQGSISYAYDAAGRRTSMAVSGQTAVTYGFDNANRLTQIGQRSANVSFGYDSDSRRTSLTLPNGVVLGWPMPERSVFLPLAGAKPVLLVWVEAHSLDRCGV
jgi:YD repeat-containing protein